MLIRAILIRIGVIEMQGFVDNITGVFLPFLLVGGLIFTYCSLTSLLKEYHIENYKNIRRPLLWFFLFEITGQVLDVSYVIMCLLHEFDYINFNIKDINIVNRIWLIMWLIYPIFQAIGMVVIKEAVDPI